MTRSHTAAAPREHHDATAGTADRFPGPLPQGLFETALAYRAASWRFEAHRRAHGLNAGAGPLLDEVTKARQLMFAVLDTLVIDMLQEARERAAVTRASAHATGEPTHAPDARRREAASSTAEQHAAR